MPETKHTKGPWEIWLSSSDLNRRIIGDRSETAGEPDSVTSVAIVMGNHTSKNVTEANAKLIAVSPDLLASCLPVLREASNREDYMHDSWNLDAHVELTLTIAEIRAIRAAVAKATT